MEGVDIGGYRKQKQVDPEDSTSFLFFVIDKYIRDMKQGQEIVLDLLELKTRSTDPAKK